MGNRSLVNMNHIKNSSNRNEIVDLLKGLAIYLVILGHVIQCYSYSSSQYLNNPAYLCIYSFHMPLFMYISGVLIYQSLLKSNSLLKIIKKRTVQLIYPYFVWGFALFIIDFVINYFRLFTSDSFENILKMTWRNFSPYWFLLSLWISSLIVSLVWYATNKKEVWLIILCLLGIIWFASGIRDRDVWMYIFFVIGIITSNRVLAFFSKTENHSVLYNLLLVVCTGVFILLNIGDNEYSIKYISGMGIIESVDKCWSCFFFFLRASSGIFLVLLFVRTIYKFTTIRNSSLIELLVHSGKYTLQMYLLQKLLVELVGVIVVFITREYYPEIFKRNIVVYNLFSVLFAYVCFLVIYILSRVTSENRIVSKYMFGNHMFNT